MNPIPAKVKSGIPNELLPAVEALNKTLDDSHFKCGKITEVFCFDLLHPGQNLVQTEQYKLALIQLKFMAGAAASKACDHRIGIGTAPAYFHAMHELYIAGVTSQAIHVFMELLAIGKANAEQLEKPYVQWAHGLTMDLVENYEGRVKFWIRAVCDPPDYDPETNWNDPDEIVMGKTWCAPMLLAMQPSGPTPFDAARQWERVDREASKQWLNWFADMFTVQIRMHVDRIAGEKTVELAKQPKPAPEHRAEVTKSDVPIPTTPVQAPAKVSIKQEYRRRQTDERNRKLRSEFKKLEKRKPGMSSVWYSRELSKSEIADGLDAETIRKIIRD